MADLSAFSNSNFVSTDWINAALKERSEGETLESQLAQLSMKLHVIAQDYSDQLETGNNYILLYLLIFTFNYPTLSHYFNNVAMSEAMISMPRIVTDITKAEDILKEINNEMNILSIQLKEFDEKNVSGSEELSRLDAIKTTLEGKDTCIHILSVYTFLSIFCNTNV